MSPSLGYALAAAAGIGCAGLALAATVVLFELALRGAELVTGWWRR